MARFLLPLLLLFSLSACDYNADSLPKYIVADYEVAFPIADTTLSISDFFQYSSLPPFEIPIPKGATVGITLEYPFYLAELSSKDYIVHWIEPKAIIGNHFPKAIDVNLSCYISSLTANQYVLANSVNLSAGETTLFADKRINNKDFPITEANKLYIIIDLLVKEDTSVQELMDAQLKVRFGLKAALQINHAL